ncbi:MAG: WbuC family cupin fold metalloprotein [Candidatus Omnitrophota bacterium]|nr:MAG: WbuC family cupin fold metalloprotein [Candidatus Omnitrophota bacterium]
MNIKKINDEVFYSSNAVTKISKEDIAWLRARAAENPRKRVRLCGHRNIEDLIHEMLIIHAKGIYVRPHKHLKKIESFHTIEGNLKVVVFDESGGILEVIRMGDYLSGEIFYYRLSESYFHTVIPLSDFVVFHEITEGPFQRKDTVFAPWAPADDEYESQKLYLNKLKTEITRKG